METCCRVTTAKQEKSATHVTEQELATQACLQQKNAAFCAVRAEML